MQDALVYVSVNFESLPIVAICLYSHDTTANTSSPSTLRRTNLKTQQSPVILDLCSRKILAGKSHGYRNSAVRRVIP